MTKFKLPRFPPRKARKTPTLIKFVVRWLDRFQFLSNPIPNKSPFSLKDRINLLIQTAIDRTSISRKARNLREENIAVPSGEATLLWLKNRNVEDIAILQQDAFLDFLESLPESFQKVRKKGMLLAIDFHTDPNYARTQTAYICKGKRKASTHQFFQYITVIWLNAPEPITLGVKLTPKNFSTFETVKSLLDPLITQENILGILADGGFYNWDLIQWFIHKDVFFVVRGRVNHGVKPIVQKHQEELRNKGDFIVVDYKMWKGRTRRKVTVKLVLYQNGTRIFAIIAPIRCKLSGKRLFEIYQKRFVIETYYRQIHRFQIFSCSQHASVRLTFVIIAIWLCNFWAYFKSPITLLKVTSRRVRADFTYTANDFCEFLRLSWLKSILTTRLLISRG